MGIKELYRTSEALARTVLRRHAKRLKRRAHRVTIDLDLTDDPTHGAQQLSFFNGRDALLRGETVAGAKLECGSHIRID